MKPLVNKKYLLEKYEGKGGWTYARIPEIPKNKNSRFNTVRVMGTIDGFEIRKYHLMPMGDGNLFLPVRAEIRKKIKKQAGEKVHVVLYADNEPLEIPGEFLMCLEDEPTAHSFFYSLTESEQGFYINWVYGAKKEETRTNRLATAVNKLSRGLKVFDKF